jgi:hypothetical protein
MSDGEAGNPPDIGMDSAGSEREYREMHNIWLSLMNSYHTKKEKDSFRNPFYKQHLWKQILTYDCNFKAATFKIGTLFKQLNH